MNTATQSRFGSFERPNRLEMLMIAALLVAIVGYLPLLLHRAATHGFGDAQVFFRAAWAVWSGFPVYNVTDNHGWSYHYPPTFAILMGPFADPMPGNPPLTLAMSYIHSIAVWYVVSVLALILAVHVWASALERHANLPVLTGRNGWWLLRAAPFLIMTPFVGSSLSQGQPDTLLILLVVIYLGGYADRRVVLASAAIALAIAIKLFPAVLLLIPFLRRDIKFLSWTIVWAVAFLFVLPALVQGVGPTVDLYKTLWVDRLAGMLEGANTARVESELSPWANDMVSVGAMLARTFSVPSPASPFELPLWAEVAQWLFDIALLGGLVAIGHGRFWSVSRKQPDDPYQSMVAGSILFVGCAAMIPVAQSHYWSFALPLVSIVIVENWRQNGRAGYSWAVTIWSLLACAAYIATDVTIWAPLRHHGPTTVVMLVLIGVGFRIFVASRSRPGIRNGATDLPVGTVRM